MIYSSVVIGEHFEQGEHVVIYDNVLIGKNVSIGNNVIIYPDTVIGDNVTILDNCVLGKPLRLGKNSTRTIQQPGPLHLGQGSFVSTGSILYRGISIGENVYIADMVNIRERVTIGDNSTIGKCVSIEFGVTIGHHSKVFDCSQITELTEIGNYVFIGPDVSLVVDPSFGRRKDDDRKIVISDNAMIGGNASIGPGVTVGENALVAMGAVVLKDVPSRKVMLGNPARVWWDVEPDLIRENTPVVSKLVEGKKFTAIAKPLIGEEEKQAVMAVMDSGVIAQGAVVSEFEKQFAAYIGVEHAIAVSSGTAALHLSLLAAGIGPGDEVITSPFTFIASANAMLYVGAKPVFVDIEFESYNLNPELLEEKITEKTKAIMPVHLFGLPCNMDKITRIAKKYNLKVIEDACQAHGAAINGKKAGSFGLSGCFSFYPTKNMTTSEGGIVTTNDAEFAEKVHLLREHGMKVRYHHDLLGYNFRMTNISAAIGLEQLKKLPGFNATRKQNARRMSELLGDVHGISVPYVPYGYDHVFHQYTIRVQNNFSVPRDALVDQLKEAGIGSGIYYPIPVHKQKIYLDLGYRDVLPITEKLSEQVLSLPVHPSVDEDYFSTLHSFFHK